MFKDMTVVQAKRYGVFTCGLDCQLVQAAKNMIDEDISALVVIDSEGCMVGIITRTDIIRASVESTNWHTQPVANYMNSEVVTVAPETSLLEVAQMLLNNKIHRVVVVRTEDGAQRPISVVSAADLLYHMVSDSGKLAGL